MNEYQKMLNNPHNNPVVLMTACCEANFDIMPACFGDPEMYICRKCKKYSTDSSKLIRKPKYEKISNGIYRTIIYPNLN